MYEIIVKKTETITVNSKNWLKVADSGNEHDNGSVYDYRDCDEEKTESTEIYRQTVGSLQLADVIRAVNKIQ